LKQVYKVNLPAAGKQSINDRRNSINYKVVMDMPGRP